LHRDQYGFLRDFRANTLRRIEGKWFNYPTMQYGAQFNNAGEA
jgi:hypothetical protein